MLKISDLPELSGEYASGEVDWMITYNVLLRLLGGHDVSEVMSHLSADLAARFKSALREDFSDEELARNGLWIDSAAGEPPDRKEIVERILAWLREETESRNQGG